MIAQYIKNHFPQLSQPAMLEQIVEVSSFREVESGQVLMDVGRYIQFAPLVLEGVIKIVRQDEDGNEILLYYLEAGETCAMSMNCCLQKQKSNIKAIAIEPTKMVTIPIQYVDEWMMKFTDWKNFILNTYTKRFDQLLSSIDVIAFKKMDERLFLYIKNKIESIQENFVASTHREIATELNTSREVVSRVLKKLELEGKIQIKKGKIYLPVA